MRWTCSVPASSPHDPRRIDTMSCTTRLVSGAVSVHVHEARVHRSSVDLSRGHDQSPEAITCLG